MFKHTLTTALGTDLYFEAPVPDGWTMPGWQGWLPADEIIVTPFEAVQIGGVSVVQLEGRLESIDVTMRFGGEG